MVEHQAIIIPPTFVRHTVEVFGQPGADWLRGLPSLVEELAQRWDLTIGTPFVLSYHYVVAARRADGTQAVLKLGVPSAEALHEMSALRAYAGEGASLLLEADTDCSAMLLERLHPGETLAALAVRDDDAATRVGAGIMRRLWRPVPAGAPFRPLAAWFKTFARHRARHGGPGPLPSGLLDRAEALTAALLDSGPPAVLLHGDLHHENVLSAQRAPWLAIDPKGMVGDPGYEVGPFLLNPRRDVAIRDARVLGRRLDVLSDELQYERGRLRDWAIAHAVLSACWSIEDHEPGWGRAIAVAETLTRL